MSRRPSIRIFCCLALAVAVCHVSGESEPAGSPPKDAPKDTPKDAPAKPDTSKKVTPELKAALEKLVLPGVKINVDEWCVDVDSKVCLRDGTLELIACTKNTKEHESIIMVDAKPSHIHTALLLLHAKPGNPAMQRAIDAEGKRFVPVPPSGELVDVYVVTQDADGKKTEHPISDFIVQAGPDPSLGGDPNAKESENKTPQHFPTHSFVFAGSVMVEEPKGKPQYLCDINGNVISIATFGDELLCLPGFHDSDDSLRSWEIDAEKLPPLDSKVILRLRPQLKP